MSWKITLVLEMSWNSKAFWNVMENYKVCPGKVSWKMGKIKL